MDKRQCICLCNQCYNLDKKKPLFDLELVSWDVQRTHKKRYLCAGHRPAYLSKGTWEKLKQDAVEVRLNRTLQDALEALPGTHHEADTHSANPSALELVTSNAGPSNHEHGNHHHEPQQPQQNQHGHGILGDDCVVDDVHDEGMSDDAAVHGTIYTADLEALRGVFPGHDGGDICTDKNSRKYPDLERLLEGHHLEDRVKKYCYQLMWDKVVDKMTVAQVQKQLQSTAAAVRMECLKHDKPCPWYPCTYPQLMAVVFGADDGCKLGNEVIYDVCAECYTVYRGLEEVQKPATTCRKCESPREGCLKYHYRQVFPLC